MQRPRIKFDHRPRRVSGGCIRIGGTIFGVAAELRDPDGQIWALLELMDGSRSVDQVVIDLVHRFPTLTAADARSGVDQIIALGYVEDAAGDDEPGLTPRQRERYSRSRGLFGWMDLQPRGGPWHGQLALRDARVILIGLGGTGSTAALSLTMSGVGRLHCVEPDIVELSNLNRQILYTEAHIGQPKIDVALCRLSAANSEVTITGEKSRITDSDMLAEQISDYDLLVMCADTPPSIRTWASRASAIAGVPWVHGGYTGPLVTTGLYRPNGGPCYDCVRLADRDKVPQTLQTWRGISEDEPTQSANAVTAGITGQLVAHMAISALTGVPRLPANRSYAFNLVRPEHTIVFSTDKPLANCPSCGVGS